MTKYTGILDKMAAHARDPLEYSLVLNNEPLIKLNNNLGQELRLQFTGKIHCIGCGRGISKAFQQGYCFPCTQRLAACDLCILKPETCHFDKGTCREPEWARAHCFVPHIVYLANSSGLKVGLTRETQIPTRWIDQGATQAVPIMRVQSRLQAGLLEVAFAQHVADKTDWRKMLRNSSDKLNLAHERDRLLAPLAAAIQQVAAKFRLGDIEILTNEAIQEFNYPVLQYPTKITSLNFDKNPLVQGILHGIKGQYLIFDSGVINIRKYTGYEIAVA